MLANNALLSAEVNRILEAPYPCSLQNLHSILQQVDQKSLSAWSNSYPCRLQALVPIVLDALECESCSLGILRALTCIPEFRHDALVSKPMLLETFLQKSQQSNHGFEKYSAVCVNLLSSPLPLAIPGSVSPFLAGLVDRAARRPSADTIRPIYHVLSGNGSHLLHALPSNLTARLQEQFKKLLQTITIENHMTHLFCFAGLAVMASGPPTTLTLQDSSSSLAPTHGDNCVVAQQYFTSKRATKTLDIVIFRVISVYAQSSTLTPTEVVESVRLCTRITEAVDISDRKLWMENGKGKLRKLSEKVLSNDHNPEVLCEVLNYITTLVGECPLPHDLLPVCKTLLCRPIASSFAPAVGVKVLLLLDEPSIQDQLIDLLQATNCDDATIDTGFDVDSALIVVESFSTGIECSAPLRQKLLYSLSTNALAEHLSRFFHLSDDLESLSDEHNNTCHYAHAQRRLMLRRKICTLFLKAAIFSQQDALSLDTSLASALLDKQANLPVKLSTCQRYRKASYSRKAGHVALFESGSTPDTHADSSSHWRERVKMDLQQNGEHQYQTIVRTMGTVCQDLERRCDEVERPLREAQAKSRQLQDIVDASKLRIAELEDHNQEQSSFLEGIEHEKSELTEHARGLEILREDLESQLDGLRQELDDTIQKAKDATQKGIDKIKELELAHAAAIAEKDEMLETQHRHEQELKTKAERLEASAAEMRSEAIMTANQVGQLQATVSDVQKALGQAKVAMGEKQAECEERDNLLERLQDERNALQSQVQDVSHTCRALREDLTARNTTVESQLVELNNLRCTLQTERAAQNDQVTELRRLHDEEVQALHASIDAQTEAAERIAKDDRKKILHLEDRLVQLTDDVESRDNELQEARQLTDQVMEFWKKPRQRDAPKGKRRLPIPEATQRDLTDSVSPIREPEVTSRSIRASPTAKRSKKQQDSPKTSKMKPRASITARTPATRVKATPLRQPLRNISAASPTGFNISPARISPRKMATKHQENELGENEDLDMTGVSICDSDFFASNDQQLVAGVHREMPQGTFDDTTAEF